MGHSQAPGWIPRRNAPSAERLPDGKPGTDEPDFTKGKTMIIATLAAAAALGSLFCVSIDIYERRYFGALMWASLAGLNAAFAIGLA